MCMSPEIEDWDTLVDTLGLAVYGIILLPHLNDYIDLAAIDIFLAAKESGLSPTMAVLANTYYILRHCHDSRDKDIRWYPKWNERDEVFYLCEGFTNVLLMGTQGCINYNPSLLLRQHGYPVMFPPTDESISPLLVHGLGVHYADILRRIETAWGHPVRKGRNLGSRSHGTSAAYRRWLQHRVEMVQIPFSKVKPLVHEPEDEVQNDKGTINQGTNLKRKLEEAHEEANHYKKNIEFLDKRVKIEEGARFRTRECLRAVDAKIWLRREGRNRAVAEKEELLEVLMEFKQAEKERQRQIG
ncbi:hypothetical protein CR513_47728, partial [Mucuna pruriens]